MLTRTYRWEPVDSFLGGSEHFIEFFWNRVNTDGRDYQSIREFAVDEEFFPSGPPRMSMFRYSATRTL